MRRDRLHALSLPCWLARSARQPASKPVIDFGIPLPVGMPRPRPGSRPGVARCDLSAVRRSAPQHTVAYMRRGAVQTVRAQHGHITKEACSGKYYRMLDDKEKRWPDLVNFRKKSGAKNSRGAEGARCCPGLSPQCGLPHDQCALQP